MLNFKNDNISIINSQYFRSNFSPPRDLNVAVRVSLYKYIAHKYKSIKIFLHPSPDGSTNVRSHSRHS